MSKKKESVETRVIFIGIFMAIVLPCLCWAGDLEPSTSPGPTMKTLDEIPPTWSQILPAAERFELVMGGAAVLDKETGLVWDQAPSSSTFAWGYSFDHCYQRPTGYRGGWRPATMAELTSLLQPFSGLPSGHPFNLGNITSFWSASTYASDPNRAFVIIVSSGLYTYQDKSNYYCAWCVRGGNGNTDY